VPVQIAAGQAHETVHLIDWANPEKNDFALAEEVTLKGGSHQRRPDIVLYLNGIAIAVIELKRSSVELADGVRQLITNQEEIFNKGFFSTVQLVLAGSDSQGCATAPPARRSSSSSSGRTRRRPQWVRVPPPGRCSTGRWRSCAQGAAARPDPQLHHLRRRPEEGAAPASVLRRQGGAGAHCPARGRRHLAHPGQRQEHPDGADRQVAAGARPDARILVITDRDELDKQIVGVMKNAGVIGADSPSPRITSRAEFVHKLAAPATPACCAR
jgi:type I restriction enzyme R subunit